MNLTEKVVADLLRDKLTKPGNSGGGEYAFMHGVRNAAGFNASRTFDAVAVNLWPSRGLTIDIYEIKVSRSDWQRELSKPDKAEDACKLADRFWIVAPKGCVRDGELPPTWGLIEIHGDGDDKPYKLRTTTQAPLLQSVGSKIPPVSRNFVVGMLRSIPGAVAGGKLPVPTQAELDEAYSRGFKDGMESKERSLRYRQQEVERRAQEYKTFEDALCAEGLSQWQCEPARLADKAAAIVRAVQGVETDRQLKSVRLALAHTLEMLDNDLSKEKSH